jgi:hypothetical protein
LTAVAELGGLSAKIVTVHELLDSLHVPHQFGGAIALAWYRNPRATTDIDLNITLAPADAEPVLGALTHVGVAISEADRLQIARDGQARLDWGGSYLDVFFATLEFHREMVGRLREVEFGPARIPILAPEHLVVCKAIFDRPKDWIDIQAMVDWGTDIDVDDALGWVGEILGGDSEPYRKLADMLRADRRSPSSSPHR